VKTKSNKQYNR